ncbi:hypothetical protein [Nocardiopsis prasina]|uniref:hypothetical protein n=1 Tax=Nocardiopsis prasina TaxID=2015 RepID=UPI000348ED7D|nr:hypothetical protein [Nocardiopsis prasina]
MTDNTEAPRGPHRTGPVLSSTGEVPQATARDAIGAPSERGPGQTAPHPAPTPAPVPAAATSEAVEAKADTERGRNALLAALALRGGAARNAEGTEKAEERYRPGRPTLAVAAIAGLMLVAAPFGLSAAKEHQAGAPLQTDLASGSFADPSSASASASASGTGVQGYVPEVQPNVPVLPGADTGADPGAVPDPASAGAGAPGGSGGGGLPERPVDPSSGGPAGAPVAGVTEDDDEDGGERGGDGTGGGGDGVGEPQGVTVEKGSLLETLLTERNSKGEEDTEKSEEPESGKGKGSEEDTEDDSKGDGSKADTEGDGAEGDASDGAGSEPLSAQTGQSLEPLSEGVEAEEQRSTSAPEPRSAEEVEPQSEPEPEPEPEPERAVAGPGCDSEGARYQIHGDGVWRSGPAGYDGAGCDDGYDVMAVSGDPDGGNTSAEWTFWPGGAGSTCTVKILVQNGPDPLWANGVPTHYELFDGENAGGSFRGGFEVTQPDDGRYWALTELQDVGDSFTLRARNRGPIPEGGEAPQLPLSVVEAECR